MIDSVSKIGRAAKAPAKELASSLSASLFVALVLVACVLALKATWLQWRNQLYVYFNPPFTELAVKATELTDDGRLYVWPTLSKTDAQAERCKYVQVVASLNLPDGSQNARLVDTTSSSAIPFTRPGGLYKNMAPWLITGVQQDVASFSLRTEHQCADAEWPVSVLVGPFAINQSVLQ